MSTFLQLAQDLRREAGISGSGPSSVAGQSGELARVVNWVRNAWTDLQNKRQDWLFQNTSADLTLTTARTVDLSATTPALTDVAEWDVQSFRLSTPALSLADEQKLEFMPYKVFRDLYERGQRPTGRPIVFTVNPSGSIVFDATPDKAYRLRADYRRSTQILSADADTPRAPAEHHQVIVWYALSRYAGFEEAGSQYAIAKTNFDDAYLALVNDRRCTPRMRFGEPLA